MSKTFLFRFDGARENDAFLEAARSQGHVVYAGLAMTLERGWIPDFIEVVIDGGAKCRVTARRARIRPQHGADERAQIPA